MDLLFYTTVILLIGFATITVYNYFTAPKLRINKSPKNEDKLVSILIPARNEESNITKSLLSAINQTYQNTEIIVLDDKSTDKTAEIVYEIIKKYPKHKITLYQGSDLPAGWNGKSWACYNLASYANGDYILFIDADVILSKYAIASSLYEIQKHNLDLLTVFPTQITKTLGETILVSTFMEWFLTSLLAIKLSNDIKVPSFSAACGQFMFMKKSSYDAIGGHSCVGQNIVEEREISMKFMKEGFKPYTYLGNEVVYCRMYKDLKSSINGFANPFYSGTKMHPIQFFTFIILLPVVYITPLFMVFIDTKYLLPVYLILLQRFAESALFRKNFFKTLILHPLQMFSFFAIGVISYQRTVSGKLVWKGRVLNQKNIENKDEIVNI